MAVGILKSPYFFLCSHDVFLQKPSNCSKIMYKIIVFKLNPNNEVLAMSVDYKKLWILLIEKNMTKPQLRKAANISPSTFTKLNKNGLVAMDVLVRICKVLDCDIGDIVEVV